MTVRHTLATNAADLIAVSVAGAIAHPTLPGLPAEPYRLAADGTAFLLPTWGGLVYNVSVGDRAFGWAADCIHPGVSIRQADDMKNRGLNVYACVGNRAKVMTGQATGARGVVTGKSGRFSEQVIVHFPKEARTKMAVGDQIVIRAEGVGMALTAHPAVALKSLAPELLTAMPSREDGGHVAFGVAARIPAHLVGAGLGLTSDGGSVHMQSTDRALLGRTRSRPAAPGRRRGPRGHRQPLQPRLPARRACHRRRVRHRRTAGGLRSGDRGADDGAVRGTRQLRRPWHEPRQSAVSRGVTIPCRGAAHRGCVPSSVRTMATLGAVARRNDAASDAGPGNPSLAYLCCRNECRTAEADFSSTLARFDVRRKTLDNGRRVAPEAGELRRHSWRKRQSCCQPFGRRRTQISPASLDLDFVESGRVKERDEVAALSIAQLRWQGCKRLIRPNGDHRRSHFCRQLVVLRFGPGHYGDTPTGAHHSTHLHEAAHRVWEEDDAEDRQRGIERAVSEGEGLSGHDLRVDGQSLRFGPCLDAVDHPWCRIHGRDATPESGQRQCRAAAAGADIEYGVMRQQPQRFDGRGSQGQTEGFEHGLVQRHVVVPELRALVGLDIRRYPLHIAPHHNGAVTRRSSPDLG